MNNFSDDLNSFCPPGSGDTNSQNLASNGDSLADDSNWVDDEVNPSQNTTSQSLKSPLNSNPPLKVSPTLVTVETAFLASAASLIWLINYYFPFGPLLKIFFPIPMALVYLRWGKRASWMTAIVSGLLLSVLMGPTRSIVFLIPYGVMGVQLGACWKRGAPWQWSMLLGTIIGVFGLFFRIWLFSILLGEDLWLYAITQATAFLDWAFMKLGLLIEPTVLMIQSIAIIAIIINNLLYLFAVHLIALLVLDRLGNPIPRPPSWIGTIIDYE
ncbi:conserved hypothetical protein [Gloeothece citriformis PCC 7424]|uniref:DUF2232 domain-containing protein n=1 Tax=Gloeothece citriformis (strain PCC 7424) TaxID=65393 RepID=B7KKX2_GLOC7|nr:DUF2232 domain-containing protein [Gloeothece citriformis]ACK71091.1 conserved hypothetical protein [Gloeothece citriformis PCC 7424]